MYDNSSCLLHQFRDEKILIKTTQNKKMENYIFKSKCKVSIDGVLYNHFDFIDYLLDNLPLYLKEELIMNIKKLELLTDYKIYEIVEKVPEQLCTKKHKELIVMYIKLRRDILLGKVSL